MPLNENTIAVLRSQIGKHQHRVFTYKGNPFNKAETKAYKNVLGQAGIDNFRFHDLRHTWASWHLQAGTPLNVLQELGGWNDYSMILRYVHLAHEHLAKFAGNIDIFTTHNNEGVKLKLCKILKSLG